MRRLLTGVVAAAVLANAASAWAQPRPANLRPTPNTDESALWQKVDRAESEAKDSAELNADPVLSAHIKQVICKVASEYCGELRVYVMDRPFFNASMAPNGYMEVWSGLLLRADSDDQLAFALGHEVGHFAENHSLEAWRAEKNRRNTALILQMAVGAVAIGVAASNTTPAQPGTREYDHRQDQNRDVFVIAQSINSLIYLNAVASMFRFSRENEMQADQIGAARAKAAGYDAYAPSQLWRNLTAETAASDFPKVRVQDTRSSIFDSHPLSADRVKALDTLAATSPPADHQDRKAYRAVIRPFLGAWLKDDLRRRDFGETLALITRLSALGEDMGVLTFYRGEAFRLRRRDGDLDQARAAYAAAAAYPDVPVAVWRNLGDLQTQSGDKPAARLAYQAYLAKAPAAKDRWLVEAALKKLDGDVAL